MHRRLADRRVRPRFEIVGELWGTVETILRMPLRNVSPGGALVQSPIALPVNSVHHVMLSNEGHHAPASLQVRHVRQAAGGEGPDYFLIGVEFLTLPLPLQEQIARWMTGHQSAAFDSELRERR
ncbi:MAG: PilZ domain-containing protein [Acidobacteria bacterium]|nr:PilZ domain-containing protein [Acidobacteriota bacterium]